jgi:predicted GNAT family acetyltransferase
VEVLLPDDAQGFLEAAAPFLLEDEARHNLMLGIAETIRVAPDVYPERRFWLVREGGAVAAAALRTPPNNLVVARPRDDEALRALVSGMTDALPGVVGAHPEVDRFAELWAAAHGVSPRLVFDQGLFALERVLPVPRPGGAARTATRADERLLLDWLCAFTTEALHEGEADEEHHRRMLEHRLDSPEAGFSLWEDRGEPVSLAGFSGATPNGIRIGPVYTPPGRRGRGYATVLVADLSSQLLAEGRRFCFLYTDLANPTSNAIYERIGYVRVGDAAQIAFDPE